MKRTNIIQIYLISAFLAFLLFGLPSLSAAQANQVPVLNSIGAKSVDEGANLNFGITATDVESIPVLTTSTLPTGATFTDNADGTGTFDWTPDYSQSGSYDVTFYATDDSAAVVSELVTITVNNVNRDPILTAIGSQSVNENSLLNFGISASDPDGTTPSFTTSTLPTGATFVDNGNGTGTFNWTPGYDQSGSYNVTFRATDGSLLDTEIVVITVTNVNRDPVLTAIGSQSVNENSLLSFGISASDPDGTTPSFTTSTLPTGATFVDNGNGTGTFNWTPGYDQSGSYNVTFRATDGSLLDTEIVVITVTNINRDPILTAIGSQSVNENSLLNFGISASDPDGTTPSFTTSTLPTGATFVDNGNGTGTFNWTPGYDQSGSYNVTFRATDGSLLDTEIVVITVTNVNRDPVLTTIGAQTVNENSLLNFNISASDPDGTTLSFTTSTLPTGATFVDNGNGTGTFNWTPGYDQSGSYNVTFRATDGSLLDTEIVVITVTNVNRDPVLTTIGAQTVNENSLLSFGISASDPDGTTPSFTTSTLPTGATFVDNGNGTGTFNWTPGYDQSGSYNVTFRATDGSLLDTEIVVITVTNINRDPILASIGSQSVNENSLLNFNISASDPDGTTPSFTTSTLPTGATFVDNGNGTGTFNWTPSYTQSGSYNVTFRATDGSLLDTEIVVITVTNVNRDPILTAIGSQSVNENSLLSFGISASDPDGTTPSFTTSTLPTGATFVDNGNGTGTFNWTPSYTQSGSYNVTFRATDGSLLDTEIVVITVTNINRDPILTAIGSQSVNENSLLSFGISASDPDGTIPSFTTSTLPTGATFVDNGDGTGTFNWTPGYDQAGSYNVTFRATDGSLLDTEIVVITVTNINRDPILTAIGSQSVNENSLLNFNISASDPDGTTPSFTTSTLPTGATFVDNGDGTGTFNWTPGYDQAGDYPVTFRATDGSLIDTEIVVITVTNINRDPILTAIGSQSVNENSLLSFGISASDPDGTTPSFTTSTLPTGATFVDNGNGTGTFNWTPSYTQSGSYNVTFRATDGSLIDTEIVVITVTNINRDPILASIGSQSVSENSLLNFNISASDPDGTTPSFTTSTLPTGATFVDNGNGTGTFNWTPSYAQSGSYNVTFRATDGSLLDTEIVVITVTNINRDPVLTAIGSQSVNENSLLSFGISASDPDGTTPSFTTSTLPTGATFVDNGNGTGTFNWTPGYDQSGSYNVTFRATDGSLIDTEIVTITVNQINLPPILASIGNRSVTEGSSLTFGISSSDPDGTTAVLYTGTLPYGATFADNGNGTGTFNWIPTYNRAGSYNVTFYARDDSLAIDSEVITITVIEAGNQAPILAAIGNKSITEGFNLSFALSAADPDSTIPVLTTSALPTGAVFTDNGNGTGAFGWTPGFTQAGSYTVTFYASDGSIIDSEIISINVFESGNQAPILAAVGDRNATEGINLNFNTSATDPDGTTPVLSASTLPSGATFINNGNGTGTFNWTPGYAQAGPYNVTFYATDGVAIDSERIVITVADAGNQAPVLAAIGNRTATEGISLVFNISATDPDATIPTLSSSTLPSGATFINNGNGTGSFSWMPGYTQAGLYNVTFYASDGALIDSEQIIITVNEAGNQTPVLSTIGSKSVREGNNLNFSISATDPDGTTPAFSAVGLPAGATFVDNGNGTGTFNWTPNYTQAGSYQAVFRASDGLAIDSEIVSINVLEAGNQAPVISSIGPRSTTEGIALIFTVAATDPDGTTPSLSSTTLPSGASYVDNGDGTGSFSWIPTYLQSGSYNISFYATDGILRDTELVTITVIDALNQLPILASIGARSTTENINLSISVSATDPEGATPTLSTGTLPNGANFVDNHNGSGQFNWTPLYNQAGSYNVIFFAVDDSLARDSEIVTITVNDGGNQTPILTTIGNRNATEAINLTFAISAADPDSTIPTFSTSALPSGATFVDNGNGTGSFSWTPTYIQAGSYPVTFRASDGVAVDSETITITVADAGNQFPVLAAIGARSATENINLSFGVSASDPDGTIPSFTTSTLPTGATFVDNGNGTGSFSWTPTYIQAGSYNITFYAGDGSLLDSEIVTVTIIEAGNQPPVLSAIGAKSVNENSNLNFGINASDPDATIPILTTSALPSGAGFVDNHNGTGTFSWTPGYTQAAGYVVTFYASDGAIVDSETIIITVVNVNAPPVLAAIGAKQVSEGANLTFAVSSSDIDGTIPTLTTSALPSGAVFTDNGNGTGSFNWTTDMSQAGYYDVIFYATDNLTAVDSEVVTITVGNINQLPILATIGAQSINENANLNFAVSASDADGIFPALTTSTLPTGATFTDNGDGTGSFDWTPTYAQSGSYPVTFRASDGVAIDSEIVTITVTNLNRDPVLAAIGNQTIDENILLSFNISASDPDGNIPALTSSALPTGATFVDNGDGTASFNWTPTYTQSGSYPVTFRASDGSLIDSEIVTITVNNINRDPILAAIGARAVNENSNLNFNISASDPDGNIPALTSSALPTGATFIDNGNGTGTFDWTPGYDQSGSYSVTFRASDGSLIDTEIVAITVTNVNRDPVLAAIGNQTVNENVLLSFNISAGDPDGAIPIFTTSTLPSGATFIDNGDGTGSFNWTPTYAQSGSYPVTFRASDGVAIDTEIVTITVTNVNLDPVLAAIGNQTVNENILLSFNISASDPDGNIPALTSSTLPSGATFVDNGDGTASFNWTPTYTQSGSYPVTFRASDGVAIDSEIVTITVTNVNLDPVLAAIGNQTVNENVLLSFNISAGDPDGAIPIFTTSTLPSGATFIDNGDGTGSFNWTPTYTQSGSYPVTFRASDGVAIDTEIVTITVTNVNRDPILTAIGNQVVDENVLLSFNISASDPDGNIPVLTSSTLPTGATFVDNGNGTGSFNWTPSYGQSGSYPVTFRASDGVAIDSEIVIITVGDINLPPVLTNIGAQAVNEVANLNFTVTSSDPDGNNPVLTTSALPSGATFIDNGDGSGMFDWTPSYTQAGSYNVTFYASDGQLIDSEIVTIMVNNTNRVPIADAGIDQSNMIVGATITLDGSGSYDPDGTAVTYGWTQVSGTAVTLSDAAIMNPTFIAPLPGAYQFALIVYDGEDYSPPDTVAIATINAAPPQAIADLSIAISSDNIVLSWPAVTVDTTGITTAVGGYIVYRDTMAYFTPNSLDSIGAVNTSTLTFIDNNIGGANVVGDTINQYFYVVISYDIYGNRSAVSNRVGEFDYQIVTTLSTDYNLIAVPFTNTGITTADQLIDAIGRSNVLTVNNYRSSSQSFESRFAAGFGVNFAVVPGGIYQVNAAAATVFSVAGRVPVSGTITYTLVTTATTDYCFLTVPFERDSDFNTAQEVMNNLPGSFNTLNNYIAGSQSYQSRFAAGFGVNFLVKAGRPYQANCAAINVFPGL